MYIFEYLRPLVFIFCHVYSKINGMLIKIKRTRRWNVSFAGNENASDVVIRDVFRTPSNI